MGSQDNKARRIEGRSLNNRFSGSPRAAPGKTCIMLRSISHMNLHKLAKNSHCSYCGHPFAAEQPWPRTCGRCGRMSFVNPLPVAVILVPVNDGLLQIRRGIEPGRGLWAFPGGYINLGETWQQAGAREVFEESHVRIDPAEIRDFQVRSAPDGTLLIFGLARPRTAGQLPPFTATGETTERRVCRELTGMAFELHTLAGMAFFNG
jgi:ADP-ribose pyrophosphatase YjhB (NUDIX family)